MFCQSNDSVAYYSGVIRNPENDSDLAKAYNFFIKKREEYADKKLIKNEIYATLNIADIQKNLVYIDDSERLNIESIDLLDLLDEDEWTRSVRVKILNDLGKIYREKKDYNEALKIYDNVLKLSIKKNEISTIQNNIGVVYLKLKKYELARQQFQLAYRKALEIDSVILIARSLDNLGFTKTKLNIESGLKNMEDALKLKKEKNHSLGIYTSYEHLSKYYYDRGELEQTEFYSNKALELAKSIRNIKALTSALRLKIEFGDQKFINEYIKVRDSIDDIRDTDRSNFNYYAYRFDKKDRDLQKSKINNERKTYFLILFILISIFLYFFLKSKHKKDKLQQVFTAESRISKKVHDEVANDVFQFMTKLQREPNSKEQLIDDLEEIYNKTRDISKEHSVLDLKGDFEDVLSDLILSFNSPETNVIAKGISDVNWNAISDLKRIAIYKILQELLINMKKHSAASVVVLTFKNNRKTIQINYNDNGVGCDLKKGSGLQNVENRMASINGSITFESKIDKGFKAKLTV